MNYKILADAVVLVHLLWIVFLFIGAVWGRKYLTVKIVHLSALAFAFILELFDWLCPLTHLEVWLRAKHNPALTYTGSFIIHYIEQIIYLDISRTLVFAGTIVLVGLNLWIYRKKVQN